MTEKNKELEKTAPSSRRASTGLAAVGAIPGAVTGRRPGRARQPAPAAAKPPRPDDRADRPQGPGRQHGRHERRQPGRRPGRPGDRHRHARHGPRLPARTERADDRRGRQGPAPRLLYDRHQGPRARRRTGPMQGSRCRAPSRRPSWTSSTSASSASASTTSRSSISTTTRRARTSRTPPSSKPCRRPRSRARPASSASTTHSNEPAVIRATVEAKVYDVVLTAYNFRQDHREEVRKAVAEAAAAGVGVVAMKTQAGAYWDKEKHAADQHEGRPEVGPQRPQRRHGHPGLHDLRPAQGRLVGRDRHHAHAAGAQATSSFGEQAAGLYCQQCGQCAARLPQGPAHPRPDEGLHVRLRLPEPPGRPRARRLPRPRRGRLRLLRVLYGRLRQGLRPGRPGQGHQPPAGRPRRFFRLNCSF
ncbi:MAG: hypothetical protein M0C28_07130 [Candidatus Moduliflexus flocculans]|nr:hypothetical protein [Candidatus Moduliflexus flocculans]